MVPRYSALLGLPGEESLACEANHTQIAKLRRGENGYYYAVKGAVLKVAGSPTILFGVLAGDNNVKISRRFPQNEIRGASRIQRNHIAKTSQARRPSVNRIPEKQFNPTSKTDEKTLSQLNFVPPDMEIPIRSRTNSYSTGSSSEDEITIVPEGGGQNPRILSRVSPNDSSSEDEITIVPETGRQNPRNAPPDPVTTASKRFRTVSGTSDLHLGKGTCEPESSGKKMLASDPLSQGQLCQAVLRGDIGRVTALLLDGCRPHTSNEEAVELSQDPFLLAARCREEQILKRFLELDADPLKQTLEKSETALHMLSTPNDGEQKSVTRSLVTLLLRHGALSESRNKDDLTPLMLSARNGEGRVVKHLLDHGADLQAIHRTSGWTPLHWAASYGHRRIVDTLISKGASLEVQDKDGLTPLLEAASRGNVRTVQRLLDHSANLQVTTKSGRTALHLAATNNHSGVVGSLISRGAPKDAKDELGLTPLMCVCQTRHTKVLKTLVDLDVDLTASSDSGETAMHYAAKMGHLSVINHLVSRGAPLDAKSNTGATSLMLSVENSHQILSNRFLEVGADLNARDDDGWTALHYAAEAGHILIINELASKGASLDAKDKQGLTPIVFSIQTRQLPVLERLLERGADLNAKDSQGWTPLHHAAYGYFPAAVDLLISKGAHLEARTSKIQHTYATPLHVSTFRSDTSGECTKLILRAGADIEALDLHGSTALILGACNGAVNAIKELIACKANIEAVVQKGRTKHRALHLAKFKGKWEIIEVLLQNGADPFALDADGIIPSQMRWFNGDEEYAAPSDTDKDRCMKLLKEGEEAERHNLRRRQTDRRDAKNTDGRKSKSRGLFSRFTRS